MDKSTRKVRIVFDDAAKCDGISLNDMIHAGPKLQQDLFNVLVRFRRNPVGVACDIKEMYLQIEIKEQYRSHFQLFWRDLDPNREPDVFEFSRVVFGKNSDPMESQFVGQENARRNQDRYPLATETVLKSTYMDDSIDSVENNDEGAELYRQLKALWDLYAHTLLWPRSYSRDCGRMRGYDWEDEVQDEIADKIRDWLERLKSLQEVKIPRCLRRPEPVKSKHIVTFFDASQQAYGAAVCMRCEYDNDTIKVPDRPCKMPEIRTSKRKEDTNACATLMTCNLRKETAPKQNNTPGVWRLDPKRYSSWTRLVRVHARVRRVLHNMRNRNNRNASMELLPEGIKDAEDEIVRLAQREAFCDEYDALSSGKPIPKKSQLITLNPCIDDDGVIRSDGRLKFADFLQYDTKFPIILPRGHWVTKLIMKNYHERGNHAAGVNFILCQLSERFWIIAAREEIREWDHECNECKRRRSKPACQIMAPLPKTRPRFSFRPFAQTAADFAGPLYTLQGRGKHDRRGGCAFLLAWKL
ncbi:uncharacterized protein [Pocillopora verrucosa]|uniref:uncharacterized protein n=1 Tax=Pocillopora verrucosa TaxID=203993 RepID=UPI00334023CA